MQIVINIKRWHIILICSILVLGFSGIYLALAQNQPVVGHSISEIFGGIYGQPIKLASGHYIGVQGRGGEQVYISGDAVSDDVQLGSFNSSIQRVTLWNSGYHGRMDLYVRKVGFPQGMIGENAWPTGHYCILRARGTCPPGFSGGSVCIDSEDDDNLDYTGGNIGDVKSGKCGSSSKLFYLCCK